MPISLADRKCYIAGKISGLSEKEFKANFAAAEQLLSNHGIIPVNPLHVRPNCRDECGSEETFEDGSYRHTWQCYMKADIAALMECSMIFIQSNVMDSPGASLELMLAEKLGYIVLAAPKGELAWVS